MIKIAIVVSRKLQLQSPPNHQHLQVCLAALAAAEAEADAWYGPYGYSNNWGYNMMNGNYMNNMFWNRPGYSQGYRQMNDMYGQEGHRFQSFNKREAEAEPEADAWYQPYGYSNWGYNMNMMNGNNMMSYWNRPYNMMYNYRYHF